MRMPSALVSLLGERFVYAQQQQTQLRLEIASLEGDITAIRSEIAKKQGQLVEHQEAVDYLKDFDALQI